MSYTASRLGENAATSTNAKELFLKTFTGEVLTAFNANIVDISIPVTVISLGPSNADAYRNALNIAAKVLAAKVAVTDGRPTTLTIGGVDYPALSLNIQMKASTT